MEENLENDKWNKLLPYQTEPAHVLFGQIKQNISQSVQQKDLVRGLKTWTDQLDTFIKIYGFQMPKKDLLSLINLYYSLIVVEDINVPVLFVCCKAFTTLLRQRAKKHMTRDDLVLQWRPLYNVVKEIYFGKSRSYSLKVGYIHLESTLRSVVSAARDYFPDDSTQEMLDEWEPLICPLDSMSRRAVSFMTWFLPVTVPDPEKGYKLWFDMAIGLSKTTSVSFPALLCKLARYNVGKIDWKPHVPWLFSTILHDLYLPVGESHTFAGLPIAYNKLCAFKVEIVVWMLGGECTAVVYEHLDILTKTYHSYLHPSNKGQWTAKLVGVVNCMCNIFLKRIEMERQEQDCWFKKIPESHRLSEEDVNRFVKIVLPSVKMAMFCNSNNFQRDYHCLVRLAPDIVLPDFIEGAFESIESVIEPQRVTTALCSVAVSLRGLCLHQPSKIHVIPLLQSLLDTISSNDLTKSWIALLALSFAFTMIPVVDCSHLIDQPGKRKKELERLWRSTAHFKDLTAVFVDKLLGLIEVSAMEDTGNLNSINHKSSNSKSYKNTSFLPDYLAEGSIYMSFDSLMRNASDDIRDMVLDKVFRYVTTTTLEVKVAGKTMGDALSNLSNIYTEKSLKKFVPYLVRECSMLLDEENEENGETSPELLWNLTMLKSVLRGRGDCFIPYVDDILTLFDRCFRYHNHKEIIIIIVKALSDLTYLLLRFKIKDFKSCQVDYDDKTFDFTSTWGQGVAAEDLKLEWFVPGEAEYAAVLQIVERFGYKSMTNLQEYVAAKNDCKERFQVQLKILRSVMKNTGHIMPMMGAESPLMQPKIGDVNVLDEKLVPLRDIPISAGLTCNSELLKNFRSKAAETVKCVYDYLNENCADDTKSFEIIALLLEDILVYNGYDNSKMKKEHTKYKSVKQMLDDKLEGKKKQLRMVIIHRIYLQQQYRQHAQLITPYTTEHHKYTQCLVELSLSKYTIVRKTAQHSLKKCLTVMPYSRDFFIRTVVEYLKPSESVSHEQLKGAIFCLCIPKITSYLVRHPHLYCDIVPVICKAQFSEKDSIINAIEHLTDCLLEEYKTVSFTTTVSDSSVAVARSLGGPLPDQVLQVGQDFCKTKDQLNRDSFNLLNDRLLEILKSNTTTWRFLDITGDIIRTLLQRDMVIKPEMVQTFLEFLTHDSIGMRVISIRVISTFMYLQRRTYRETLLDPTTFADDGEGSQIGERPSNMWLQYKRETVPTTEEAYNSTVFVDKPHLGYNRWPKKFSVCIEIDKGLDDTTRYDEIDTLIVNCFKDGDFIERFTELYSLENNKGAEKTDSVRRILYRDLFRNYGWSMFKLFQPKVEAFVSGKIESQHRFAAELLSAVTRGAKHWPFCDIEVMWDTILPLIMKAMQTISSETINMWMVCISSIVEDRDPRRFVKLTNLATQEFLSGRTIFHDTSNCCLIETIMAQYEWKFAEGLHELLVRVTANLNNNYKNVRNILGHLIDRCTVLDNPTYNSRPTINPTKAQFLSSVLPLLTSLDDGLFGTDWVVVNKLTLSDDNDAVKVVKTVTSWLLSTRYVHGQFPLRPAIFPFLSYVIALQPSEADPDLKFLATKCLSCLSRDLLLEDAIVPAITAVKKVLVSDERSVGCTWKAKCTALVYLQVMCFQNLYTLRTKPDIVQQIRHLLFDCLKTSQVEVRQVAAQTVGGLAKTELFGDPVDLLVLLKQLASTPLPKGTKKSQTDIKEIWIRHGAVKTTCALIESFPYSIPEWMPQTLVFLSRFARGNVMIANEVEKCMSNFKRTHLDSWEAHKHKFSEEELCILQDLLVSPNYYA